MPNTSEVNSLILIKCILVSSLVVNRSEGKRFFVVTSVVSKFGYRILKSFVFLFPFFPPCSPYKEKLADHPLIKLILVLCINYSQEALALDSGTYFLYVLYISA